MALPYYKRFPRDFLEGTIGLSFEVKGAYAIVLDLIYMRDGRLPDDARYIAGQLGCSVRKWTAILAELVEAGKLQVSQDGIISNFRSDYLTEESRKYQDKQAEIAGNPRKNNPLRQPKPSQSESEPEREGSEDKSSDAVRVVVDHDRDAWSAAVGILTERGAIHEKSARSFFGRLLSANGIEARDLLPSLASALVNGTQDPQAYLTRSAQAIARRRTDAKPKRVSWV